MNATAVKTYMGPNPWIAALKYLAAVDVTHSFYSHRASDIHYSLKDNRLLGSRLITLNSSHHERNSYSSELEMKHILHLDLPVLFERPLFEGFYNL